MKKKIIITALSVMLASSSIIPAYAAEPLPEVERTADFGKAMKEWASMHVEECNKIRDAKERYRHIVQLVSSSLNLYETYLVGEDAVLAAYRDEQRIDINYYIDAIVHLSNACGLEAYQVEVYGNSIIANGRTNYMPCVYFDDIPYITGVQNIENGDAIDDYLLMPDGKYGVYMTLAPRKLQEQQSVPENLLKFHTTIDLDKGITVIYDSDGTFTDLVLSGASTAGNGVDRYYVCENTTLHAVSLDTLLEFGYDGPY